MKIVLWLASKAAASRCWDTADCATDYNRMKSLGVKFQGEPQSGPWGTGVLFDDLYGNKIFMSQEP